MYVFYDKNGVLKEIITERKFRNGDSARDKIYIYIESEETYDNGLIKYKKPDNTITTETTFSLDKVGKELPREPLRNLSHFSYTHTYYDEESGKNKTGYLFYEITIPDEVLGSATEEANTVIATIRFVVGETITQLGVIPFSVDAEVGVITDNSINVSQYNYLVSLLASTGTHVEANPSGTFSEYLKTILIGEVSYGVQYLKDYVQSIKIGDNTVSFVSIVDDSEKTETFSIDFSKYVEKDAPILKGLEYPDYPDDESKKYCFTYKNNSLVWVIKETEIEKYIVDIEKDEYKLTITKSDNSVIEFDVTPLSETIKEHSSYLPSDVSENNKLVTVDTLNSSIESVSAYYVTKSADGQPFDTKQELDDATVFYSGGVERNPTRNDYTIVLADESKGDLYEGYASFTTTDEYIYYYVIYNNKKVLVNEDNKDSVGIEPGVTKAYLEIPTTRYVYSEQWEFAYIVNNSSFTSTQWKAINSGATAEKVTNYDSHIKDTDIHITAEEREKWNSKQDIINAVLINDEEGTLTDEQSEVLLASELNYIWYKNNTRLNFEYKDDETAIYSNSDGANSYVIKINLGDKSYVVTEDALIPTPPTTGIYYLKSVKGVKKWIKDSEAIEKWVEFEAIGDSNTITLTFSSGTYKYSTDGETWKAVTSGTTYTVNNGSSFYLVGIGNSSKPTIAMTGSFNASGKLSSLVDKDYDVETTTMTYAFAELFKSNTSLVDCSELELDFVNLKENAYYYMFYGCTSLVNAPELPATTLANSCYSNMFYGCTSLETTPKMTISDTNTYSKDTAPFSRMFGNCPIKDASNIVINAVGEYLCYEMFGSSNSSYGACKGTFENGVPSLSATTLANYCYYCMFYGCTSLVNAPELPATTLANYCYSNMFYGCTSLVNAPELPATTLASYCYYYMFQGCTSLVNAPELPATTLASDCYSFMFSGCTSLVNAPALSATELKSYCYYYMFQGCTSLKISTSSGTKIFTCPATIPTNAVVGMFTSTGGSFTGTPTAGNTYYWYN